MFRSKASNLHVDDIGPKPMWFFPSLSFSLSLSHTHCIFIDVGSPPCPKLDSSESIPGCKFLTFHRTHWSRSQDMKYVPPLSPTTGPSLNNCFMLDYLGLPGNGLPLTNFSSFPLSNCHKLWSLYFLWFQVVFFCSVYVLMICRSRKIGRPMSPVGQSGHSTGSPSNLKSSTSSGCRIFSLRSQKVLSWEGPLGSWPLAGRGYVPRSS